MNAYERRYAESVCWTAIGGTPNSCPIAGNAGRYESIAKGASIDSEASNAANDQVRRGSFAGRMTGEARALLRSRRHSLWLGACECRVDRRAIEGRREAGDEIVDVPTQERPAT